MAPSQDTAYQDIGGMLVSPQPVLRLRDEYDNQFSSPVESIRIYIEEVVDVRLQAGVLVDVTQQRDICQNSQCWQQMGTYVRFTSLSIDINNIDFIGPVSGKDVGPRSYSIHFSVTASGTTDEAESQNVRVASASPLLSLDPNTFREAFPPKLLGQIPALGLKWEDAGDTRPQIGVEIVNEQLQSFLEAQYSAAQPYEIAPGECEECDVSDVEIDSYLQVNEDGQSKYLKPIGGYLMETIRVEVRKANQARDLATKVDQVSIHVSLVAEVNPRGGTPQFASGSITTQVAEAGEASFTNLKITTAGKFKMVFSTSPITFVEDGQNFYFSRLDNFLTLSARSTSLEVTPGELHQIVVIQQPQDVLAIQGCYDDYSCVNSLSYPPLKPFPRVSPADAFGNGIGGWKVYARMDDSTCCPNIDSTCCHADLTSDSGRMLATSGDWRSGGYAVFTDLSLVPRDVDTDWDEKDSYRIAFHIYDDNGISVVNAVSHDFTAAYMTMSLDGHMDMEDQEAGNELSRVEFRAVDESSKNVLTARSPVSAAIFREDGTRYGDILTKFPQSPRTQPDISAGAPLDNGMVEFTEISIEEVGRYFLRFTYLDLQQDSNVFSISPGNAVKMSFVRQPNNVHVNQVMVPPPILTMLDTYGNQANLVAGQTITISSPGLASTGITFMVDGFNCGVLSCSLQSNVSPVVVSGISVGVIVTDVTLVFRVDGNTVIEAVSAPFSVTSAEPSRISFSGPGAWSQPTIGVEDWLNPIRIQATDADSTQIPAVDTGTLQDGGLNFVVLSQSARLDDDYFTGMMLLITGGPGVGQQAKIRAYAGASRRASVALERAPTSQSQYEIQYVAKLAIVSFNGIAVDLGSTDTLMTDTVPPKHVAAFVGPDEAMLQGGEANFMGISMRRAGKFKIRISIDKPSYLGGRAELVSREFEVLPGEPAGFYVSTFDGGVLESQPMFSADGFIPPFFAHIQDKYGNDVKNSAASGAKMRLQASGGVFAPRAPGFEIRTNENPFDVLDESMNISSVTLATTIRGKATFDGLRVQTTGREFRFLISTEMYAPQKTMAFEIYPGEATRIIVLRQPLDFKLNAVGQGVIPSQPRICVLDAQDNSLVVRVRVDLLRGEEKCGTIESLREQGLEDLFGPDYTCTVDLSKNPYVDTRDGIDDGTAEFTDLAIKQVSDHYVLQFLAQDMRTLEFMNQTFYSQPFSVVVGDPFRFMLQDADKGSFCPPFPGECLIAGNTLRNFSMIVVDAYDNRVVGKSFLGLRCQVRVPEFLDTSASRYIQGKDVYVPVLSGTTTVDVQAGIATFTDLAINQVSTFEGTNDDPTGRQDVEAGSWVLEFLEPPVNSSLPNPPPSLFPGNTYTSAPFKVVAGEFFALGVNGFGTSQVFVSTEMPTLEISGIDEYGNFVGGAEGIVMMELSGVDASVKLYGTAPQDPENPLLEDFRNRELIDGRATYDGLILKTPVSTAKFTFWIHNEFDAALREPQVVLGPFTVNSLGRLRVTRHPSSPSYAGSPLGTDDQESLAIEIVNEQDDLVEAAATVEASLYNANAEKGSEWDTLLAGTLTSETVLGRASFSDLVVYRAGSYQVGFRLVYPSGDTSPFYVSNVFDVGPANRGECRLDLPCQIAIVRQPPASLIVTEEFEVEALIVDNFGNPLNSGFADIAIKNNPTADPLQGNVQRVPIGPDGRVTFTELSTEKSCSSIWCQFKDTSQGGYRLEVSKDSSTGETEVLSVDSLPEVEQLTLDVDITEKIVAGKLMRNLPQVRMRDRLDNLVVNNVPPRRWTLRYTGPGCLPCRHNAPCSQDEASSHATSMSECKGASEAIGGILHIGVEAPTIVGQGFTFEIQVMTWEGDPVHAGFLTSNLFDIVHADTDAVIIVEYEQPFPHLVAGNPFSIDIELFDFYRNPVTSGTVEASLLGPDNIAFDLDGCADCSTSETVVEEGGSITTMRLQITQMQMDMELEIALTHVGTGEGCVPSSLPAFALEDMCQNPFTPVPDECPRRVMVVTDPFRVLNAEPDHLNIEPLPPAIGAGTENLVVIHIRDRFNNLMLDIKGRPVVDFSVSAADPTAYAGLFPPLEPYFLTSDGGPVGVHTCYCGVIYKGIVQVNFPAPLAVADNLELNFSIGANVRAATFFQQDVIFNLHAVSNKISILAGNARSISIDQSYLSDFNRFDHPLYQQPCVRVADIEGNPVAPLLRVEAHICNANGTTACELAGIAETDNTDQVCFSGLEVEKPKEFNLGVAHFYFTFVAGGISQQSPLFRVYDLTGLQVTVQPATCLSGRAMVPAPEVWLCFGSLPCDTSQRVFEWPHTIMVDVYDDKAKRVSGTRLPGAAVRAGSARFDQIVLRQLGEGFTLRFSLQDSILATKSLAIFSVVSDDVVSLHWSSVPSSLHAGERFNVSLKVMNFSGHPAPSHHSVMLELTCPHGCETSPSEPLQGVAVASNGIVEFYNLEIRTAGQFLLSASLPGSVGVRPSALTVNANVSVLNTLDVSMRLATQSSVSEHSRALAEQPTVELQDRFGNPALHLDGRRIRAVARDSSCNAGFEVSGGYATVMKGRAAFHHLSVRYAPLPVSEQECNVVLEYILCSASDDCTAKNVSTNSSALVRYFPEDAKMVITAEPSATMVGNYSDAFLPQIMIVDDQGQLDESTNYTIFMTLKQGQFLGSVALLALLERAPGVESEVVIHTDRLTARVKTVGGRAAFDGLVITQPGADFRLEFRRCHVESFGLIDGTRCNFISMTPHNSTNFRTSKNFEVLNSQLTSIKVAEEDQEAIGRLEQFSRLITLSDRAMRFLTVVEDAEDRAIGSRSYMVKAELYDSAGTAAGHGILQGKTHVYTRTGLADEEAGQADFTDLRITKTGQGWRIRFSAVPDCTFDAVAMREPVCDEHFRSVNTRFQDSLAIDVGHDSPHRLAFVSQPRNATSGYSIRGVPGPAVQVQVMDLHGNPVTCSARISPPSDTPNGLSAIETGIEQLILATLPACDTSLQSPLARFPVAVSLELANGSAAPLRGTAETTTHYSNATFSALLAVSAGTEVKLKAILRVSQALASVEPSLAHVQQESEPFHIWATSFDILEISGCPRPTEEYEAGQKFPGLRILGVFANAGSGLLRASVEGTCPVRVGCSGSDVDAPLANVYAYNGPNPGRISCEDESLCLLAGGSRNVAFEDGQAHFHDFAFPPITATELTVRLAVSSPFEAGRHLYIDCPPVKVVSAPISVLEIIQQPLPEASAGEPLIIQPSVGLNDEFGNNVPDRALALKASACLPCPCPCLGKDRIMDGSTVHGLPCKADKASSWTPMGSSPAECVDEMPFIEGNVKENDEGLVTYRNLRVSVARTGMALVFLLNTNAELNVTSSIFDVHACSPHVLKISDSSPLSAMADTGVSLCAEGRPCELTVRDIFGNLILDPPVTVEASLDPTPSASLAGFGISALCACTGSNTVYGVGAAGTVASTAMDYNAFVDASYGLYCRAWDTYRTDCASMWSDCTAGLWCCRPWCYVSDKCPSAIPDTLVPGLFYSYQACSADPDAFWKCPYRDDGNCPSRNASTDWYEVESIFPPPSKLRGKSSAETVDGMVVFTDLHVTEPGKYTLTFKGFFGSQILYWSGSVGVTPLYARKLRLSIPPNNKTTTGSPLVQQPIVTMLDEYDNPVMFSGVCQAVTASVATWSGRQPYGTHNREPDRFVYGQNVNDTNLYPANCDTDIQNDCIVTANADEGRAAFAWMHVGGGPSDGLILNFTTGCCNPDPNLCYCADSTEPNKVDRSRRTEPTTEPCSFVTSPPFTLKRPVRVLTIFTNPSPAYRSGEKIDLAVELRDEFGNKVTGGDDLVSTEIFKDGIISQSMLVGDAEVQGDDGVATFRNLQLEGLTGTYQDGVYASNFSFRVKLPGSPSVRSIRSAFFTVQSASPTIVVPFFEPNPPEANPVCQSIWTGSSFFYPSRCAQKYRLPRAGFIYQRTASAAQNPNLLVDFAMFDQYGNFAPHPGATMTVSIVEMERDAHGDESLSNPLAGTVTAEAIHDQFMCCQTSLQQAGAYQLSFVTSVGVSINLHFQVSPGVAARLIVSDGFSTTLIAWEAFYLRLEVVDNFGNFVEAHDGLTIRLSCESEIDEPLRDDNSIEKDITGCTTVSRKGFVVFDDCRPKEMSADAAAYPGGKIAATLLIGGDKNQDRDAFPTLRQDVELTPPAVQFWITGCMSKDSCDAYHMERTERMDEKLAECQKLPFFNIQGCVDEVKATLPSPPSCHCSVDKLGLDQAAHEPFFYFPRVELRDSAGTLATASKLEVSVQVVEPTPDCVTLFGTDVQAVVGGVTEFTTIGVNYDLEACTPYNWRVSKIRMEARHQDHEHLGQTEVQVRNILGQTLLIGQVDGFGDYIHDYFTFTITYPVTKLDLEQAPEGGPAALAGLTLLPLLMIKTNYLFTSGPDMGSKFPVEQSSRYLRVRIYKCTTPAWSDTCADDDQSPTGVLVGNTTIMSVDGVAIFRNISIVTVGTFYLEVDTSTAADAEPYRVKMQAPFSEFVKITASAFAKLRVVKMPSAWGVGTAIKHLEVELLDKYNNRLDCQYGECARPWYGFPDLVGKRDWPLLTSSDATVSVAVDQARLADFEPAATDRTRACGAGSNFLGAAGACSCLSGSLAVKAIEGLATLDCLSVGMAGVSLPLVLSAGDWHFPLAPFDVIPGAYQALYVTQEPQKNDNVAGEPILYCPLSGCVGLSVQMVDLCGNYLSVDEEVEVDVSVCPDDVGLSGTTRANAVQGRATFTNLMVSRASNTPCELADSVHFKDFDISPCMQRFMPYVFTFTTPGISVVSASFIVGNGPMQTIEIVQQPGSSMQGHVLTVQPQVKLVDAFANTVTQDPGGGSW